VHPGVLFTLPNLVLTKPKYLVDTVGDIDLNHEARLMFQLSYQLNVNLKISPESSQGTRRLANESYHAALEESLFATSSPVVQTIYRAIYQDHICADPFGYWQGIDGRGIHLDLIGWCLHRGITLEYTAGFLSQGLELCTPSSGSRKLDIMKHNLIYRMEGYFLVDTRLDAFGLDTHDYTRTSTKSARPIAIPRRLDDGSEGRVTKMTRDGIWICKNI
jgi:hypothetical protein